MEGKTEFQLDCVSNYIQECESIQGQRLACVSMSGWCLIQRSEFDCYYNQEPYTLVYILLNQENGHYFVRAWNHTIDQGALEIIGDLEAVLHKTFQNMEPCLANQKQKEEAPEKQISLQHPRTLSKNCALTFSKNGSDKSCLTCLNAVAQGDLKKDANDQDAISSIKDENLDVVCSQINSDSKRTERALFQCDVCPFKTRLKSAFGKHEHNKERYNRLSQADRREEHNTRDEESEDKTIYYCEIYSFKTQWENSLKRHMETKHSKKQNTREYEVEERIGCLRKKRGCDANSEDYSEEVDLECEVEFVEGNELEGDDPTACELLQMPLSRVKAVIDPLECRECGLKLKSPALRAKHEKLTHGYGRFKCLHCPLRSWKLEDYIAHTRLKHPKVTEISCNMCNACFDMDSDHFSHFRECFYSKKIGISRACMEKMKKRKEMAADQRQPRPSLDESEKSFLCHKCKFKSKWESSLRRHLESKHGEQLQQNSPSTNLQNEGSNPEPDEMVERQGLDFLDSKNVSQLTHVYNEDDCQSGMEPTKLEHFEFPNPRARENPLECRACQMQFQSKAACHHHEKKIHAFGLFKCSHCENRSWRFSHHVEHMSQCHPEFKKDPCALCKEEQAIESGYFDHYVQCYVKRRKKVKDESILKHKEKLLASGVKRFFCDICSYATNYANCMLNHKNKHEREANPEEASKLLHYCDFCGKGFATRNYLGCHIRDMHSQKQERFQCDQCEESFLRKPQLKKHKAHKHSDDPKLNCTFCGVRRGSIYDLKKHMNQHTGEDNVVCKDCGATVTRSKFKAHERIHTGEKPYACQLCDMRFMSTTSRYGHMKHKHKTSATQLKKLKEEEDKLS